MQKPEVSPEAFTPDARHRGAPRAVRPTNRETAELIFSDRRKRAYKPGSVSGIRACAHLPGMAIHLGRRLPAASSDLPDDRPGRTAPGALRLAPALSAILFGLAPDGVCPAVPVAGNAVSSYLAFSPLLSPSLRRDFSGMFSVALSVASPRLAVSQHPVLWCPDFPPGRPARAGFPSGHPARFPIVRGVEDRKIRPVTTARRPGARYRVRLF